MSEITKEALREHNYCMGLQIGAFIKAMGMHWENQIHSTNGYPIPYRREDFQNIFNENFYVLTHNGIMDQWEGVE